MVDPRISRIIVTILIVVVAIVLLRFLFRVAVYLLMIAGIVWVVTKIFSH